jgi:Ser-tRNA(Ala) deacylase AlaX
MISSQGSFAIKMLTPTINITNEQNYWDDFKREYTRQSNDLVAEGNLNSTSIEKMFLQFLKNKNIYNNIGLYKSTNSDSTEWSRITLDDNNTLKEQPCNK